MRGAPIHPDEYDGEHLNSDAKLEAAGWAAGLDVWEQMGKAYEWYLHDNDEGDTLANAQMWSLREAIRAELKAEILAGLETPAGLDDALSAFIGAPASAQPGGSLTEGLLAAFRTVLG